MTIQNDRWLVCYNFKTHDGKGEITHSVLNDQEASEAWEGEELEEIFALAREDVCMKLGLDEGADGDVLGEMVLTSVVPLGRIDSISVAVDGDDYGEEFDTMTQGIRIEIPVYYKPIERIALDNLKSVFSTVVDITSRAIGGVLRLTSSTKKETLQ